MIQDRENDFIKSDDEKRKLIDAAGSEKDHKGADAVIVFDHTWGDVEVSGLGNLYNNRMVKLLTDKGIADFSVLRFDYDPRSYINDVLSLRIHRKEGGIEDVDVTTYRDVMQPESMLYWRVKMKLYELPHLRSGDAVEWTTFKKGFNVAYLNNDGGETPGAAPIDTDTWVDPKTGIKPPMYGAFFDIVYFRERLPIKDKRYTLLAPRSMPLSHEYYFGDCRMSCLIDDEFYTYSWEKKDIDGYKPEERMPGQQSAMPKLLVSSIHDWKSKSRWFFRVNQNQFHWNDDIEKLAKEITAPWQTDEEKATACLHWAAQEVRYIGFSIGPGEGYTLHPGTMSIGERGGVCKDIAGACITLMRAAGYEVYPAQTQALFPVNRVPADQFDHCVVAWRKPDGTWEMLDPTWAPYSMNIWDTAEAQQNYLIGTPEGEDLGQTKLFTPEESKMTIQTSSSLAEDGTLTGQVRWLGLGRSDSIHRSMRAMQPAVGADRAYQRILESIDPGVEILKAEHTDEEDLYKSYENNVEYRIANYAFVDNGEMSFHIPLARLIRAPQMARYLSMANTPERKFDLFVIFLQLVESEEILTIPDGYELAGKPVKVKIVKDTAEYEAALTEVDGKLKFTARFIIKVRTITKEQYKEFKELTDKAKAVAERWITLRRKPGHGVK